MTFRSIFARFQEQLLKDFRILRKSWRTFRVRSLLERCFRGFVLPVSEYCSADTHLKLLDRAVSSARFLTGSAFECDIAHRRPMAGLCMLFKIWCNSVHLLNGALPGPYVLVRVTLRACVDIGTLMLRLAAEPHSATGLSFPSQCLSRTISLTSYSMVWDWLVSRAWPMFIGLSCCISAILFYFYPSSFCL